ncbi:hypothetical protein JNB_07189 [Janibacter sp. HTCC2649]|nr:hypothetical protein JNB_07189 [Janibacter sp. HTCC2649]
MEPTLHDGDLLLVLWGRLVRPGAVAVVRLPPDTTGTPRPLSIKRVTGADPDAPDRWWIDSDNLREGVTSFDVGSLGPDDVLAVALARVWPRPGRVTTRHTP